VAPSTPGPADILADVRMVGLTNVVCQVGLAQDAVAAALDAPNADADVAAATAEWRRRCDAARRCGSSPRTRSSGRTAAGRCSSTPAPST
jgi:aspartate/methionine/tyrosine aminotransferase